MKPARAKLSYDSYCDCGEPSYCYEVCDRCELIDMTSFSQYEYLVITKMRDLCNRAQTKELYAKPSGAEHRGICRALNSLNKIGMVKSIAVNGQESLHTINRIKGEDFACARRVFGLFSSMRTLTAKTVSNAKKRDGKKK